MNYTDIYIDFLLKHAEIKKPLKIVADASNGATGQILTELLPKLGLKNFVILSGQPDPEFPDHGPNPLLPGVLNKIKVEVLKQQADLGVAFDADGDRAFFVDDTGVVQPSFITAALLFKYSQPKFVADELVYQALNHMKLFGEDLQPSKVGVFFVKQKMREISATTGAEFSGHFYFKDFFGADSGIFALIQILNIISKNNILFSNFAKNLPKHEVRNEDINIAGKDWQSIQEKIITAHTAKGNKIEYCEGITIQLPEGWVNIRPSNTEPVLRFYAGAETKETALAIIADIKQLAL